MQMPRSSSDFPKRGWIYVADLNPGFGREIHKRRPVLVISSDSFNQTRPHVVIIPTTSIIPKLMSDEIVLLGKMKGLENRSVLLPLYIRSIDQVRLIKKIVKVSKAKLQEVEEAIKLVLDLQKE